MKCSTACEALVSGVSTENTINMWLCPYAYASCGQRACSPTHGASCSAWLKGMWLPGFFGSVSMDFELLGRLATGLGMDREAVRMEAAHMDFAADGRRVGGAHEGQVRPGTHGVQHTW
jgi:hypothetical protein